MECIIVIDIGSSRIKCTVFDLGGLILNIEREPCELHKTSGGFVERDAQIIWKKVFNLLVIQDEFIRETMLRVCGLICTGAGDGLLLLDKYKNPVTGAISSLDTRAARMLDSWNKSSESTSFYKISGEKPYAGTPASLLRWFKINEKTTYDSAEHILFIKDWIKYCLTGVLCTDFTDSSATLTRIDGEYNQTLFQLMGINEAFGKTIEQIPSHEKIGIVSQGLISKLPSLRDVPVFSGVHDCTGSALGCGCVNAGDFCIITGSWAGNDLVVDRPILDEREEKHWLIRSYAIPGKFLIMSSSPTAFVNLDWFIEAHRASIEELAKNYNNKNLLKVCDAIVEESSFDKELCYHPYLFGSQLVHTAAAGFNGLRPWHTVKDLLRALYEGIGFNYRNHYEDLFNYYNISNITVCGGGSNSQVFLKLLATILGKDIYSSLCTETTSLGTLIPAVVGLGLYPTYEAACASICVPYTGGITFNHDKFMQTQQKATRYDLIGRMVESFGNI